MAIKIELDNTEIVDEFLASAKNLRTTGRGILTDSWVISQHLKDISRRALDLDIEDTLINGVHIFVSGNQAIVSGANFKDTKTIESLSGREFSTKTHGGELSFRFGEVLERFKLPVIGEASSTVSLSFFLNSVVFSIEKLDGARPDFYHEMTLNTDLLKDLGRPILPSGEPSLDAQMMDFESDLPLRPTDLETNISKIFTTLI